MPAARSASKQNRFFGFWNEFHGGFSRGHAGVAALLTVYSFAVYLIRHRSLFTQGR
jgi:hypothetical protein